MKWDMCCGDDQDNIGPECTGRSDAQHFLSGSWGQAHKAAADTAHPRGFDCSETFISRAFRNQTGFRIKANVKTCRNLVTVQIYVKSDKMLIKLFLLALNKIPVTMHELNQSDTRRRFWVQTDKPVRSFQLSHNDQFVLNIRDVWQAGEVRADDDVLVAN